MKLKIFKNKKELYLFWIIVVVFILLILAEYIWITLGLAIIVIFYIIYSSYQNEKRIHALKISDIDNMSGFDFEHYIGDLLSNRGYKIKVTKPSGDFGSDIIALKDGNKYSIQVKRRVDNISRNAVSDAVAAKDYYGCNMAMVVTNSSYTSGAIELAKATKCILVDREILTDWILDFSKEKNSFNLKLILSLFKIQTLKPIILILLIVFMSLGVRSTFSNNKYNNKLVEDNKNLVNSDIVSKNTPDKNESNTESVNPTNTKYGFLNYSNERYGFSIDYPINFIKGKPPANGDGLSFTSQDGTSKLTVYGSNGNSKVPIENVYDNTIKGIKGEIGYHVLRNSWFVVTWKFDGIIYYQKTFHGQGSENTFIFSYPENKAAYYNDTVMNIEGSFNPGNLTISH